MAIGVWGSVLGCYCCEILKHPTVDDNWSKGSVVSLIKELILLEGR